MRHKSRNGVLQSLAFFVAAALRRAAHVLESVGSVQTLAMARGMLPHDMAALPNESYYLDQYWHWVLPEIGQRFPDRRANVLDVGCGQGRLALPLAAWLTQGRVIGVDLIPGVIERAVHHAEERGLTNIQFFCADALEFIRSLPDASVDMAVMTEVTFFMPKYREVIRDIARVLKPGSLFFASFRSQYFDLLQSVRSHDWQSARLVRDAREGHWGGGTTWFSWHTVEDIKQLLGEAGFTGVKMRGIGIASGIEDDPLSLIAQPSRLEQEEKAQLLDLELSLAEQYAENGRYILATAEKIHL